MAIQFRLGAPKAVDPDSDPLGRSEIGYPTNNEGAAITSEEEVWQRGRGVWKMNADRALAEDEAHVLDKDNIIRAVATIRGIEKCGDRFALFGDLVSGHERVGTETEYPSKSLNPVSYTP